MVEVVDDPADLPLGSHALSFHSSQREAADQAIAFLDGRPVGQPAAYWVAERGLLRYYRDESGVGGSAASESVRVLRGPQVRLLRGRLRPVESVRRFVAAHPEGVTAAGETLTRYWTPHNILDHLEYEAWFNRQPWRNSRFLCPYDLRRIPPDMAPRLLRALASHHSHVVLSRAADPAGWLLQLFAFGTPENLPDEVRSILDWAAESGWTRVHARSGEIGLTPAGRRMVLDWYRAAPALGRRASSRRRPTFDKAHRTRSVGSSGSRLGASEGRRGLSGPAASGLRRSRHG
jgi:hypothetical protein